MSWQSKFGKVTLENIILVSVSLQTSVMLSEAIKMHDHMKNYEFDAKTKVTDIAVRIVKPDSGRGTSLAELIVDRAKKFLSGVHGPEDVVSVGAWHAAEPVRLAKLGGGLDL